MGFPDLRKELITLSKLKNNWYSVAGVAKKVLEAGGADVHRRMRDAAEASQLSLNTLKRMMSVRDFLDSVKEQMPGSEPGKDPNELSYPNLELVKRLYQVNQDQGIRMLGEVVKGEITFRDLRDQYNKLVTENISEASSQQIARINERDFATTALTAVKSAVNEIFNELQIEICTPRYIPLPVDAVGYEINSDSDDFLYAGFEFIPYRGQANWKQILENLQYRTVFSSYFFKRYWIVFSENTGQASIAAFCKILVKLDCKSIGVAILFSDTCQLGVVHTPTCDPAQDWSDRMEDYRKLRVRLLNSKSQEGSL